MSAAHQPLPASQLAAYARVVAEQRLLRTIQPLDTIQCPCCGHDTAVPYYVHGIQFSGEQLALRERMKRAGLSYKAIRYWFREHK